MLLVRLVRVQTLSYPRTIVFTLCNVNHVVLHDLYLLSRLVSRPKLEMTGGRLEHNRFHSTPKNTTFVFVSRNIAYLLVLLFLFQWFLYFLITFSTLLLYSMKLRQPLLQMSLSSSQSKWCVQELCYHCSLSSFYYSTLTTLSIWMTTFSWKRTKSQETTKTTKRRQCI